MSHKIRQLILCFMILALAVATALAYTPEQASNGKELYGKYCAVCHGANGEGGAVPDRFDKLAGIKVPPVAGPGKLPKVKTAGQAYDFAKKICRRINPAAYRPTNIWISSPLSSRLTRLNLTACS